MKESIFFRTNRTRILSVFLVACLISCGDNNNSKQMKLKLTQLPVNGLYGDLAKGVSASYAALIDQKLIVAGGANFPGKLGFEGG